MASPTACKAKQRRSLRGRAGPVRSQAASRVGRWSVSATARREEWPPPEPITRSVREQNSAYRTTHTAPVQIGTGAVFFVAINRSGVGRVLSEAISVLSHLGFGFRISLIPTHSRKI